MNFAEKYTRTVVTLSVLQLKAILYTQFFLFFQYCAQKKNISANWEFSVLGLSSYGSRNMKITQFTGVEMFAKSL